MNYEELIGFIETTNIKFKFEDVVRVSEIITKIDFDRILQKDYQIIKEFFSTASTLNLIPKEYNEKINLLITKM